LYTAGDHFNEHEKGTTCCSQVAALLCTESLLFDFGLVNSIAGLGLAGLDVELVLFSGSR